MLTLSSLSFSEEWIDNGECKFIAHASSIDGYDLHVLVAGLPGRYPVVGFWPKTSELIKPPQVVTNSQRCVITELPDEILLQIDGHLVTTNGTYHILPTSKFGVNLEPAGTAIHRIPGKVKEGLQSWTKYCDVSSTSTGPLSKRSAPYVKDLTLLVSVHDDADHNEVACQEAHIGRFVVSFTAGHSLSRLVVDMRMITPPERKSRKVPVWIRERPRVRWNVQGQDDFVLPPPGGHEGEPGDEESFRDLWLPFRRLRGVEEVELRRTSV
ncbi:uncharacterized protein LTR77_001298 [Saxophila tyrrhenica]|uniref:Uncharacterized protein n=1 Tax=Saxophila tyrrhenica TaxID=1690608 RepID=A0AAV9PMF2_9PEZI|nr:hypothetical protein LTR77_001298 [Saxophila tyrrhenica]